MLLTKKNAASELRVIIEGGAVGHLSHLNDDWELTFGELKKIITMAGKGELRRTSEKYDGQNLVFSWSESDGDIKLARNGGEIKGGGLDVAGIAKKFYGRGNVEKAFTEASKTLKMAISSMDPQERIRVFGDDADYWYSMEVIYPENANVINYDGNSIVFHPWPVFKVDDSGSVVEHNPRWGVEVLTRNIETMQKAIQQRNWKVYAPAVIKMQRLSDDVPVNEAVSKIDAIMRDVGMSDSDTIGDYMYTVIYEAAREQGYDEDLSHMLSARILNLPDKPTLNDLKKMYKNDSTTYDDIREFVKNADVLQKSAIRPIEAAIYDFSVEILKGLYSALVADPNDERRRLVDAVKEAITQIQASGNPKALAALDVYLEKMGGFENIVPIEGLVFLYKGKAYKFVGAFSAINQILGLFKYGRA